MKVRRKVLAHVAWSAMCVSVSMGLVSMALVSPAVAQRSSQETKPTLTPQPSGADDRTPVPPDELPDSPGSIVAQAEAPGSPQPLQQPMQSESSSRQSTPQKPVGTAAAEAPSSAGVAASQPAGVAIAPAKQRRARTLIIRTGAIIGAAVAVGVVVGLTEATSSKPPGAH